VTLPHDSEWAGKTLKQLNLGKRFGVHVSSIIRGKRKINIPSGNDVLFPQDELMVIGSDAQMVNLTTAMQREVVPDDPDIEQHEMQLRRIAVTGAGKFVGVSLQESGLRNKYGCMLIGLEADAENLISIAPSYRFEKGDIMWVVGEEQDIKNLTQDI
jgi:CPA2 family monovalent cation:H+ antiporter-2